MTDFVHAFRAAAPGIRVVLSFSRCIDDDDEAEEEKSVVVVVREPVNCVAVRRNSRAINQFVVRHESYTGKY